MMMEIDWLVQRGGLFISGLAAAATQTHAPDRDRIEYEQQQS